MTLPASADSLPADTALKTLGFRLLHVGVAVPDLVPATKSLQALFGYRVISGPFEDPIQRVAVNFLTTSAEDKVEIELIAPLTADAPVQSMLKKNGGGAYHFCFETADIEQAITHAKALGCMLVSGPDPAVAFEGRRIAWLFAPTRQLFELVEAQPVATV